MPVAQGIDKKAVLDKGVRRALPGNPAQPGAEGNFALAGHRNTHGEPFRYLNGSGARVGRVTVDVRGRGTPTWWGRSCRRPPSGTRASWHRCRAAW
ncbi:sortase domain-bontaining protein [Streptomyces cirratus]